MTKGGLNDVFTPFRVLLSSSMPPFVTQMPSRHQNNTVLAIDYLQNGVFQAISEDDPSTWGYFKDCLPAQTSPNKPNARPKWRDGGSLANTMIGHNVHLLDLMTEGEILNLP